MMSVCCKLGHHLVASKWQSHMCCCVALCVPTMLLLCDVSPSQAVAASLARRDAEACGRGLAQALAAAAAASAGMAATLLLAPQLLLRLFVVGGDGEVLGLAVTYATTRCVRACTASNTFMDDVHSHTTLVSLTQGRMHSLLVVPPSPMQQCAVHVYTCIQYTLYTCMHHVCQVALPHTLQCPPCSLPCSLPPPCPPPSLPTITLQCPVAAGSTLIGGVTSGIPGTPGPHHTAVCSCCSECGQCWSERGAPCCAVLCCADDVMHPAAP